MAPGYVAAPSGAHGNSGANGANLSDARRGAGAAATGFEPRASTGAAEVPDSDRERPPRPAAVARRPGSPAASSLARPGRAPRPWWRRRVPLGALRWLAAAALALARLAMLAARSADPGALDALRVPVRPRSPGAAARLRHAAPQVRPGRRAVLVVGAPLVEVARAELGGSAEAATRREGRRFLLANVRTSTPSAGR